MMGIRTRVGNLETAPGTSSRKRRTDEGFTLVELMVAMTVTMLLLAILPSLIETVSNSNSYAQGTTTASIQVRTAVQDLEFRVESSSQICLPTQLTTVGPSVTSGYAVRVLSSAFGSSVWVQWWLNTSTNELEKQVWPVTWTSGNAVPQWIPVASGIVNLSTVPFGLPTAVTGSPQSLTVSLQARATTSNKTHTAQLTTTISALDN